jgi:hypothetical protein
MEGRDLRDGDFVTVMTDGDRRAAASVRPFVLPAEP